MKTFFDNTCAPALKGQQECEPELFQESTQLTKTQAKDFLTQTDKFDSATFTNAFEHLLSKDWTDYRKNIGLNIAGNKYFAGHAKKPVMCQVKEWGIRFAWQIAAWLGLFLVFIVFPISCVKYWLKRRNKIALLKDIIEKKTIGR